MAAFFRDCAFPAGSKPRQDLRRTQILYPSESDGDQFGSQGGRFEVADALPRVAVLGFESKTGDPAVEHWRVTLARLVVDQLGQVAAIRLSAGVEAASRQAEVKNGEPLDPDRAHQIGALLQARLGCLGHL